MTTRASALNSSMNIFGVSKTNYNTANEGGKVDMNSASRRTLGASQQLVFGLNATTNPTAVDPIVATLHKRILEHLGGGGFKAVGRLFRMNMDPNVPNARMTFHEVKNTFAECGVEVDNDEMTRLFTVVAGSGIRGGSSSAPSSSSSSSQEPPSSVEIAQFLWVLRGPLPRARAKIVEEAWAVVDPKGTDAVPAAYIVARYCARLHPVVAKGEATASEVAEAFESSFTGGMGSADGTVSKEEFLDYYAGISDSISNHDYFNLILRNTWRIGQPHDFNKTEADHQNFTKSQFQSSAYRGCDGSFPAPDLPDSVAPKREPRFASMISNDLVPFPIHKIGACPANVGAGVYRGASVKSHKINTKDNAEKVCGVTLDFNKSSTGQVPSVATSRGFLDDKSTTQTMHGEFSDKVMGAYSEGRAKELKAEEERREIYARPLATADPNHWGRTSDSYGDYRRVDRSEFTATNALPKLAWAEGNRQKTQQMMEAGRNVDIEELKAKRDATHDASLPKGYVAPSGAMLTTMKDHFAEYDVAKAEASNDRWASEPLQHRHQVATEEEKAAYTAAQEQFAKRNEGDYGTEKSTKHRPILDEAEVVRDNDVKGVFSVRNGVRCIKETVARPRDVQSDLGLNGSLTRNTVVPGQFVSMSSKPLHTPH